MQPLVWTQLRVGFPGQEVYGASDDKFQFVVVYEPKMGSRPWSWSYKRLPVATTSASIRMGHFISRVAAENSVEQFRLEHSK